MYREGDPTAAPSGRMPKGGFYFNTVHNVQAQTPEENLVGLYEAFGEARG